MVFSELSTLGQISTARGLLRTVEMRILEEFRLPIFKHTGYLRQFRILTVHS